MISSFELRGHHLELRSPGALGGGDVPARALPEVDGHGDAHIGQARGRQVRHPPAIHLTGVQLLKASENCDRQCPGVGHGSAQF